MGPSTITRDVAVQRWPGSVEIGTVMFGARADGSESPAAMDLVRLAMSARRRGGRLPRQDASLRSALA